MFKVGQMIVLSRKPMPNIPSDIPDEFLTIKIKAVKHAKGDYSGKIFENAAADAEVIGKPNMIARCCWDDKNEFGSYDENSMSGPAWFIYTPGMRDIDIWRCVASLRNVPNLPPIKGCEDILTYCQKHRQIGYHDKDRPCWQCQCNMPPIDDELPKAKVPFCGW